MDIHKKISIYRLCRNDEAVKRLREENRKYKLGNSYLITNLDYFNFLNKIIGECHDDFVLVCHDDVVLPINIYDRVKKTIDNANSKFGVDFWGVVGNAGVEFLSEEVKRSIKDPHSSLVNNAITSPIPVISIDGNTLLLNLENLRKNNVMLPRELSGFHLYDLVLLVECYKKGLICAVDSNLYVIHRSGGSVSDFFTHAKKEEFLRYWKKSFINNNIITINGSIEIKDNIKYLMRDTVNRKDDFYDIVHVALKRAYKSKERKRIHIIIRTTLGSIARLRRALDYVRMAHLKFNDIIDINVVLSINNTKISFMDESIEVLKKTYSDIKINFLLNDFEKKQFPRVYAIKNALNQINDEDAFVWIVDDDDFIYPEAFKYFPILLNRDNITTGNAYIFIEDWRGDFSFPKKSKESKIMSGERYYEAMMGNSFIPVCSVIYPIWVLRKVFEYELLGDYFEDYAIFLISQSLANVSYYPILLAGISYHGKNTVHEKDRTHWDYSFATFLSEIINSGIIKSSIYELIKNKDQEINFIANQKNQEIGSLSQAIQQKNQELNFIKSSKFWKARERYMDTKFVIQNFFLMKILKKAVYLAKSFWYSLKREGFVNSLVRLFYYIKYGKGVTSKKDYEMFVKAKRGSLERLSDVVKIIKKNNAPDFKLKAGNEIDIIIPVYNGLEYLKPLFGSIFKNTRISYRLIAIDDCSPDKNVYKFLKKIKEENPDKNIKLIRNKDNLGFVKTVNKAVKFTKNHFVVLNTDTEVPEGWLKKLMYPIFKSDKISSVTPFTNSGIIYSFPNFLNNNEIFENLGINEINKYFRKINIEKEITVPTGMGFCMGFNKYAVNKIGMFDESSFGKGYGEENDWCVRAEKAGYKNIIAPNLFVYHKHGGSFDGEERKKLLKRNLAALNKKHPGYDKKIRSFIKKDPLKKIRDLLIILISTGFEKNNKPILFFDHELGGGTNIYREKFIEKIVKNGKKIFVLSYDMRDNIYYLKYFYKNYKIGYTLENIKELSRLLDFIKLEEIILSQIVSYKKPLEILAYIQNIKREQNCRLKFLLHDYFCVCPSYNLLNQDGKYCNIPKLDICRKCMDTNKGQFRLYIDNKNIELWRGEWKKFLGTADEIICFSESSKDIIKKAYNGLDDKKIKIIPHKVDYIKNKVTTIGNKDDSEIFNIGILGGINPAKGSKIIREIIEIINKDNLKIKIVIIGQLAGNIKSNKLIVTGKYKQEEIESLVKKYKINAFLIPSVWPETFSYTAEEIMQMRMPLAVFNLGAPAERVKKYEKGKIIPEVNAKSALDTLLKMKTQILQR